MAISPLILVANEPGSYRSLLAEELPFLRPDLRILAVEPDELDTAVASLNPAVVICSYPSEMARWPAITTLVLYPEGDDMVMQRADGAEEAIHGPRLADILRALDQAVTRIRS